MTGVLAGTAATGVLGLVATGGDLQGVTGAGLTVGGIGGMGAGMFGAWRSKYSLMPVGSSLNESSMVISDSPVL